MQTQAKMEKKVYLKKMISILSYDDNFTISSSQRYNRLLPFFEILKSYNTQGINRMSRRELEKHWTHFLEKLNEVEVRREEIATFVSKKLRGGTAFINYSKFVLENLLELNITVAQFYENLHRNADRTELIRTLTENCGALPTKACYEYLNAWVLPAIFDTTSEDERRELCDLVMRLPLGFAFQFMTRDDQKKFRDDALLKYLPFIWKHCFAKNWRIMCMALLHYTGRLLHNDNGLTNAILKIVEAAFKNSTVEEQCSAFECWRVAISNYALDKDFILQTSKSGLLLKPIQARISRNRIVTSKKYDIYVHFLQQIDFAKAHVEWFFMAAFGPIGEEFNGFETRDDVRHFRDLKTTCPKSTEILLKILGHTKHRCDCINRSLPITDVFHIKMITIESDVYTWQVLVDSVRLCTQMNINWLPTPDAKVVLKCLWTSLFSLSLHEKYTNSFVNNLNVIVTAIKQLLHSPAMNEDYYKKFFNRILECLTHFLEQTDYSTDINTALVQPVIIELLNVRNSRPSTIPSVYGEVAKKMVVYATQDPQFATKLNTHIRHEHIHCQFAADSLLICMDALCRSTLDDRDIEIDTLCTCMANVIAINSNMNITPPIFSPILLSFMNGNKLLLEQTLAKCLIDKKQLPGLYKVVSSCLLNCSISENEYLFDIVLKCLSKFKSDAKMKTHELRTYSTTLIDALKNIVEKYGNDALIDVPMMHNIIASLLKLRVFDALDCLKRVHEITCCDIPQQLIVVLESLQNDEEVEKRVKTIGDILSAAQNKPKTCIQLIDNVVITPKRDNTVRLFGQTFDSPSSKKFRESIFDQGKNEAKQSLSTASPTPPVALDDLSESAFVVCDKQVVVDAALMTDEQKDKTHKRRDDIPALYNDLTQSQDLMKDKHCSDKPQTPELAPDANGKDEISITNGTNGKKDRRRELKRLKMNIVDAESFCIQGRTRQSSLNLKFSPTSAEGTPESPNKLRKSPRLENKQETPSPPQEHANHVENASESNENHPEQNGTLSTEPDSENVISPTQDAEVRVNLYRLPALSPTKRELQKAKTLNEKLDMAKVSPAVCKLDFHTADSESEKPSTQHRIKSRRGSNKSPEVAEETSEVKLLDDSTLTLENISEPSIPVNLADTVSIVSDAPSLELTSETNGDDDLLAASPVLNDTPTRNKELIDSAADISPIHNADILLSPELFKNHSADAPESVKLDETPKLKNPSTRSAKLLNLVGHKHPIAKTIGESLKQPSSPKTERILKMMQNCADQMQHDDENRDPVQLEVLEFNRPLPSPLAKPASSCLRKRKLAELDESVLSPLAKRKCVNFPDPPTTSEKVFFNEDGSYCLRRRQLPQLGKKKKLPILHISTDEPIEIEDTDDDDLDGVQPLVEDGLETTTTTTTEAVAVDAIDVDDDNPSNPPPEMLAEISEVLPVAEKDPELSTSNEASDVSNADAIVYRSMLKLIHSRMGSEGFLTEIHRTVGKREFKSYCRQMEQQKRGPSSKRKSKRHKVGNLKIRIARI